MRVIAGAAKGRRLRGPGGDATRPLTDRAKEALFSSLGASVAGAVVLDLYAGSGQLGIEALSRGAGACTFVERDRRAVAALRANVGAVGLGGHVEAGDVERFLARESGERADIVFLDPPYAIDETELAGVVAAAAGRLSGDGVLVVHRRHDHNPPDVPAGFTIVDRRRYGDTVLWWIRRSSGGET